jgi:hypothetical protein
MVTSCKTKRIIPNQEIDIDAVKMWKISTPVRSGNLTTDNY